MDEVASLAQVREIRDIVLECCINYVKSIESAKSLNPSQISSIKKYLNIMAKSVFEKARQEVNFSYPIYESLPIEPVSALLQESVSKLEKELETKREQIMKLRREVPEQVSSVSHKSIEDIIAKCQTTTELLLPQDKYVQISRKRKAEIYKEAKNKRAKVLEETNKNIATFYHPSSKSFDYSIIPNQIDGNITNTDFYSQLVDTISRLPDKSDLLTTYEIRSNINTLLTQLHSSLNQQILSTKSLRSALVKDKNIQNQVLDPKN